MNKKYNWRIGDKVKIRRKLTENDYRWVYPDVYKDISVFAVEPNMIYKITDAKPMEGNCVQVDNGALIPNHMLLRNKK